MRSPTWPTGLLALGIFAISALFTHCGGDDPQSLASAIDEKTKLEESSGLGTYELTLSEHTLWQEEGAKPLVIEMNAGPDCAKTTCTVTLETSDRAGDEFRVLGELFDEGDSGDVRAKDGIYTRTINLDASTYAQRVIRFRAHIKDGPSSNLAYLNVGPRIGEAEVKQILKVGEKFGAPFDAAVGNGSTLATIAAQIRTEPGIAGAVVSLDSDGILVLHKKGVLGIIEKKTGPNVMGSSGALSAAHAQAKNFPGPTCGGWEGEAVQVSPYAHQFGSSDPGVVLGEILKSDPKERFRVQQFASSGQGTGLLSWYAGLFNKTNVAVVSSHGSSLRFPIAEIPTQVKHLGRYELNGTTWRFNGLATNYIATNPGEKDSKLFSGSIWVSAKTGEAHLTPQFFFNQRGRMKKNSFAYLGFCSSGADPNAFIAAFRSRGASVVFAFDDDVQTGFAVQHAQNIADAALAGKNVAEVSLSSNPGTFTSDGVTHSPNLTITADEDSGKNVSFSGAESPKAFSLSMKAGDKNVQLRPYGCFLHGVPPANQDKVWTCRWTRTGEKDSAPSLNVNFLGENPPETGKAIHGFDALIVYGERECTDFNSTSHPELVTIKVTKWDASKGEMALEMESTLSNNGTLFGSGEDAFKLLKLEGATGTNLLLDREE